MFLLLSPGVFSDPITLTTIIIIYFVGSIDIMIRPVPEGKPDLKGDNLMIAILILNFSQPFLFIIAYYKNILFISQYFTFWNTSWVGYTGIVILIVGGIIMIISRIQLGIFAIPVLIIEEEHQLITKGIYKYIRHPMYLGTILALLGPFLAFRSIIMLILTMVFYIVLIIKRMAKEEKMLIDAFGEEYISYMKQTKRLIPLLY